MKIKSFDFIEKLLLCGITILILLMMGFNYWNNLNRYYSVYYAQGEENYNFFLSSKQRGFIIIKLVGQYTYPDLEVLLNGESYGTFGENTTITMIVKDRDLIQINGRMYNEKIILKITDISSNIKNNIPHKEFIIDSNVEILSFIQI